MNILYILVPAALMLAALGVAGFIWSVRSGQFDDVETPGMRVLFEDEAPQHRSEHHNGPQEDQP